VLEYGRYTSKADVYSFGVVLWELFSYGKLPYSDRNNEMARAAVIHLLKIDSFVDFARRNTAMSRKLPKSSISLDGKVS
jgi:hypothetical protein